MVKPVSSYFFDNGPSIYFSVIGGAMFLGTAFMLARRVRLLLFGSRTEGVVVALNRRMQQDQREKPSYMPVVRFHVKAEPVEFQSWTGGSGARYRPGDQRPSVSSSRPRLRYPSPDRLVTLAVVPTPQILRRRPWSRTAVCPSPFRG